MATIAEQKLSLYEHLDLMDLAESEGDSLEVVVREQITTATAGKVENIHRFLVSVDMMDSAIDAEIERLREKKQANEHIRQRVKNSVQYAMEAHDISKISGKTVTFSLRSKPASVVIADELAIPDRYKSITVKLPLQTWSLLPLEELARYTEAGKIDVSKSEIKKALDAGEEVPGADLSFGQKGLVVK